MKVETATDTELKAVPFPKGYERQFAELMTKMTEAMAEQFKNNTLKKLNKGTIEKFDGSQFEDAQIGNYANIFLDLAKKAKRAILKRFDDDRLDKEVERILRASDRQAQSTFYNSISGVTGITVKQLTSNEGLTPQINALIAETQEWVKKLRDDNLAYFTNNTLRVMAENADFSQVMKEYNQETKQRKNHAQFIARNQMANFNGLSGKIRAQKWGITEAVWETSKDERVRHSHAARQGKVYQLDEGLYSSTDGKTLYPGTDYNCFPGNSELNHTSLCRKVFRRWYSGELTKLVTLDGKVLECTPNHPILTRNGFKAAHLINVGDDVVVSCDKSGDSFKFNGKNMIPTFEQVFSALNLLGVEPSVSPSISGKFHGDTSNSDIDVIDMDCLLGHEVNSIVREKFTKLSLSKADEVIALDFLSCNSRLDKPFDWRSYTSDRVVSCLDLVFSSFITHLTPLERFCFALGSWRDAAADYHSPDYTPGNSKVFGDKIFAFSVLVHGADAFLWKIDSIPGLFDDIGSVKDAKLLGFSGKNLISDSDLSCGLGDSKSLEYKFSTISDKSFRSFSGHIYNLETVSNDYICNTFASSNCRCVARYIIPGVNDESSNG